LIFWILSGLQKRGIPVFLHRKRRDANHGPLAKLAERIGASHMDTSQLGDDYPDAVIGFRGVNYLIEFKIPGKKLKPGQERFQKTWRGQVHTIKTADEFLALLLGEQYATKKAVDVAASRGRGTDPRGAVVEAVPARPDRLPSDRKTSQTDRPNQPATLARRRFWTGPGTVDWVDLSVVVQDGGRTDPST